MWLNPFLFFMIMKKVVNWTDGGNLRVDEVSAVFLMDDMKVQILDGGR